MKNTTIMAIVVALVVLVGAFVFLSGKSTGANVVAVDPNFLEGESQKVTISEKDLNYYPSEIKVNANQPVEITLDDSVKGCLRAFTIKDLGISEYAQTTKDKIVFTPTQKGKYRFACTMGMGYGTLVVE